MASLPALGVLVGGRLFLLEDWSSSSFGRASSSTSLPPSIPVLAFILDRFEGGAGHLKWCETPTADPLEGHPDTFHASWWIPERVPQATLSVPPRSRCRQLQTPMRNRTD